MLATPFTVCAATLVKSGPLTIAGSAGAEVAGRADGFCAGGSSATGRDASAGRASVAARIRAVTMVPAMKPATMSTSDSVRRRNIGSADVDPARAGAGRFRNRHGED